MTAGFNNADFMASESLMNALITSGLGSCAVKQESKSLGFSLTTLKNKSALLTPRQTSLSLSVEGGKFLAPHSVLYAGLEDNLNTTLIGL